MRAIAVCTLSLGAKVFSHTFVEGKIDFVTGAGKIDPCSKPSYAQSPREREDNGRASGPSRPLMQNKPAKIEK